MVLIEFYSGNYQETNYEDHRVEIQNELDIIIQKMKMILYTESTEVIGIPSFGIDLEQYLFSLKRISTHTLKQMINDQFYVWIPELSDTDKYEISIDCNYEDNVTYDSLYIDILINNQNYLKVSVNS